MVFDKVYLIKSISAITNYNRSSCLFGHDPVLMRTEKEALQGTVNWVFEKKF